MKWISVKERLPEKGLQVLIYSTARRYYIGYLYKQKPVMWYSTEDNSAFGKDAIKYWLPLPAPPKEEGNE